MVPRRECVGGEEGGKEAAGMWKSAKMLLILILVLGREMTVLLDCRSMLRG